MSMFNKLSTDHISRKEYFYNFGTKVSLKFHLRQDTKKEMQLFRQLLERAIKDVDNDLANIK